MEKIIEELQRGQKKAVSSGFELSEEKKKHAKKLSDLLGN